MVAKMKEFIPRACWLSVYSSRMHKVYSDNQQFHYTLMLVVLDILVQCPRKGQEKNDYI